MSPHTRAALLASASLSLVFLSAAHGDEPPQAADTPTLRRLANEVRDMFGAPAPQSAASSSDQLKVSKRATNRVVVRAKGGDYSNPVAAAKNAFSGDRWCELSSDPRRRCVMFIDQGVYWLAEPLAVSDVLLLGAGREATKLIAKPGVETAVIVHANPISPEPPLAISDLTIINLQLTGAAVGLQMQVSENSPIASRVAVDASGGNESVACRGNVYVLDEVTCRAFGGRARGAEVSESLQARNSELSASDSETGTGLWADIGVGDTLAVVLSSTNVSGQVGIELRTDNGFLHILGGAIVGRQVGVRGIGGNQSFRLTDTAVAGSELGVGWSSGQTASNCSIERSTVQGTTALELGRPSGGATACDTKIHGATLTARETVIRLQAEDFRGAVAIDHSTLEGPNLLEIVAGAPKINIGASKLDGTLAPNGAQITCAGVYDGNYKFFVNTCPPGTP
jgi:hypothetical protein